MSLRFLSTWVLIWYVSVCAKVPTYVLLMSCSTWDMSPLVTGYILRVLVEMCPQVSRYVQLSCARVKYICQWILFFVQLIADHGFILSARKISHCPSTKRTTFPSCWVCASPPANYCTMIQLHCSENMVGVVNCVNFVFCNLGIKFTLMVWYDMQRWNSVYKSNIVGSWTFAQCIQLWDMMRH